jgi:hypothetical protein
MGKFRKKPVVIEAVQFDTGGAHKMELPEGVEVTEQPGHADNYNYMGFKFGIKTKEGMMEVSRGDWIITGVEGERYACKPSIFLKTYEPVDEEAFKAMSVLPRGPDKAHELPRGSKGE